MEKLYIKRKINLTNSPENCSGITSDNKFVITR